MTLGEVLEQAIENNLKDLQALVLFLVQEKEVLTFDDDSNELDLYFLEKHNERMNQELHAYKAKLNMEYDPIVVKFLKSDSKFIYVLAKNLREAKHIARNYDYKKFKICEMSKEMSNGLTLKDIVKGKQNGVLGGME